MNASDEIPPVPDGIGVRGGAFWRSVQEQMEFDARETDLLVEVCRSLDMIDRLSSSIAVDGVMIVGSQGQRVLNSAVAELRQQQASYARLVLQLNLEGAVKGEGIKSARAATASETAKRRWQVNGA